ncbi:MAG TPA: valine--tRNA ligase [Patescibacteria group bacterium]|nr:valine--tRNA ligase [Patescibacteria group bacterium]
MDPQYNHEKFESNIYKEWEKSGAFAPTGNGKPFTIIMPPPNANDPLHIGHARFVAIEDVLVRYHRMKGEPTLWLPGSDHAGIETQFVFEKKLSKDGKSRFDYDRETLYKMIWDYVQDNTGVMESQLKKLGASCDWSRFKFTLDPEIVKVVYGIFKKLYDDGLIYRGERIVNYCPRCGTAYSQLEMDSVERDDNLYYLDYGTVTIATTRPETIFADVAVAVSPKSKKYANLVGKTAKIPLINRTVPVIADNLVDNEFGTGALKITPAHDATDFEIGQAHKLPLISVIDEKGRMTGTPEKYIGMKVLEAREEVVKNLEGAGLLVKTEKIHHTVSTCYRDHGLLEPTVSKQWFVKVDSLAKNSLKAIASKKVNFPADKYRKIAVNWLKNLKDWNISRQIVWGMRIPAWRCQKCMEWTITDGSTPEKCSSCKHTTLTQDEDRFDTWFSSGQWPFATLQTTKEGDFEKFYPTTVMNTGYDILPIWVVRMLMLGIYATGKVPFETVLLHGLVRDKDGLKISKSKGNVINPIEMTEKYGADALRMGLLWGGLVENDIALSEEKINGQRKFANKVWNVARFVTQNKSANLQMSKSINEDDKWILEELKKTTHEVTKSLDEYRLNEAAKEIYEFIWNKFADIYIEKVKLPYNKEQNKISVREGAGPVLYHILDSTLRLLHPFMPFVTEQIWKEMGNKDFLITSSWPAH